MKIQLQERSFRYEKDAFGDWTGARSGLRDEGITPTASYVAALQTNPGGHVPQERNYDGQLSLWLDFNLHKILSVPGLSFYLSF